MKSKRGGFRVLFDPSPLVLVIDDDPYVAANYIRSIEALGIQVHFARTVQQAIQRAETHRYDAVIVDIMMPHGRAFTAVETAGGYKTGVALGRELADLQPDVPLLALTNSREADVEAWYTCRSYLGYYCKHDVQPDEFAIIVRNRIEGTIEMPKVFLVHGRDHATLLALKNFLQNTLGLPEPLVLAEQPSRGMTLIEKFEHYAEDCDVVFALFTPDDLVDSAVGGNRARQNVVFEFGYFLGTLGRRSGRVFLVYKQGVELPSDLQGVVYIDITNGIESAGESIRRELRGLFDTARDW